jgi:hypothetical protein
MGLMTDTVYARQGSRADPPPAIFRRWVHSREDDADGLEVFRPEGFEFPPSFGRDGFEMHENGEFVQEDVGPADGIVRVAGRWAALGPLRVAVSFSGAAARAGFTVEIVTVDDAVLRIRRAPQQTTQPDQASVPAMDHADIQAYQALPQVAMFRRLDFDEAQVIALRSFPPQFILRVSGTKPYATMDVELVPFVYVRQPDYWEIEVVGSLRTPGVPVAAPYAVSLPLAGRLGTRGIEVVGANRSQRIDVPAGQAPQGDCRNWTAWIDLQPPGPPTLHVAGECEVPSGGYTVELRRREPQGFNPRDLLLDKIVTPPSGPVTGVVSTVEARYSEETTAGYDTVTILPGGPSIEVSEAH